MFNPDEPREKKERDLSKIPNSTKMLSVKQKLKFYILDGGMADVYGFQVTMAKRLKIFDAKKLNRFDGETKSILMEIYEENKA